MTDTLCPPDEPGIAAAVAAAARAREPLAVEGNGTKRAMLRPVQAARTLSTRAHTGITLYRPTELVLSARAGTPLPEIEAALAEKGQALAPEPPDTRALFATDLPATIGGIVATNLSGPRRITAGAIRDHVLGLRFVNGAGEVHHSGGRVLKNVTGLDLCKLLTGSHGTLGVITEVTLKVLPAAEASATVAVHVPDLPTGIRALSAALGSPFGVTGAALLPPDTADLATSSPNSSPSPPGGGRGLGEGGARSAGQPAPTNSVPSWRALLRIEDFPASVAYRSARLAENLKRFGDVRVEHDSAPLWRAIRDAAPLNAAAHEAVWRVSVRPSAAPAIALPPDARTLLDWGGGLVWIVAPATEAAHAAVAAAATAARGSFTLFRAPEPLRAAVAVIPEEPPALAAIGNRVKAALDPAGILNPGRMRHES